MQIIHGYRHNDALRASFNALSEETFGLNFENWYRNGFWGDNYDPWSVVIDGKVIANVSLNRTDLTIGGERRRIYQLGTVMTDPAYRNRGYIRAIMAEMEPVLKEADGVYLFANDSVVDFYPKFGFHRDTEYLYSRPVSQNGENRMEQVSMDNAAAWEKLSDAMAESRFENGCLMVDNPGLIFFYVSQFMQENVYFCPELKAWAIAELEEGELLLHNIFAPAGVTIEDVAAAFGSGVTRLTLGFAPENPAGYEISEIQEEDSTFFTRGPVFAGFAGRKLRIPSLSHA